jgi:hypothetical protein
MQAYTAPAGGVQPAGGAHRKWTDKGESMVTVKDATSGTCGLKQLNQRLHHVGDWGFARGCETRGECWPGSQRLTARSDVWTVANGHRSACLARSSGDSAEIESGCLPPACSASIDSSAIPGWSSCCPKSRKIATARTHPSLQCAHEACSADRRPGLGTLRRGATCG